MARTTCRDVIKNFLNTKEIKYIFGNPGTTETTFLSVLSEVNTEFILALHESSATGIAAGYAMITNKPSLLHIHTYPGIANAMFNLRNAHEAGLPIFVIAGQQDTRVLIHNPVLSGPNTQLASTACKYTLEIQRADDLSTAMQRCYVQSQVEPRAPVFLSIPFDLIDSKTENIHVRKTTLINNVVPVDLTPVISALKAVPKGKLVIIADYAVGADRALDELSALAERLGADVYATPFHTQTVADPASPCFRGEQPPLSKDLRATLEQYDTLLLLGCKIETFLMTGDVQAVPDQLKIIQISPAQNQLGFDYPVDLAVCGNIKETLSAITKHLDEAKTLEKRDYSAEISRLEKKYGQAGRDPSDMIIVEILTEMGRSTHIVTEGSSEDALVQDIAPLIGYQNVHFSPRGGGLGWAMPVAVGIALAKQAHSLCFVGDGGSMYSIHALWSAAKYRIPTIFVCFINHEYRVLKDLQCAFEGTNLDDTKFIGLDFNDPQLGHEEIARGFGAKTLSCNSVEEVKTCLNEALAHTGPTVIYVTRRP